uniref:Uncharacterized protein n=1 Tax=Salmo trutta TaxID=8032 RepID=A0A673XUW2_SALTR
CPVLSQPCCPVLSQPCCPVLSQPCCPVLSQPCCPVLSQPCCPVLNQPCCPVLRQLQFLSPSFLSIFKSPRKYPSLLISHTLSSISHVIQILTVSTWWSIAASHHNGL